MMTRWMAGLLSFAAAHGAALGQSSIYGITSVEWNAYSRVTAYGGTVVEANPDVWTSGSIVSPTGWTIAEERGESLKGELSPLNNASLSQGIARFQMSVVNLGETFPSAPGSATLLVQTLARTDGLSGSDANGFSGDLDVRAGASVTIQLQLFERSRIEIDPYFGGVIGCAALRQAWQHSAPGNVGEADASFQISNTSGFFLSVYSEVAPPAFGQQLNDFSPFTLEPGEYTLRWMAGTYADVQGETSIYTEAIATIPLRFTPVGPCIGDITGDGVVDDADFVVFAAAYNILDCADPAMPAGCPADLNADGFVDDSDFVAFAAAYNTLLCP